jgi:hypothetical protein
MGVVESNRGWPLYNTLDSTRPNSTPSNGTFLPLSFLQVLDLWQQADAVCFDIDRTVTTDASVGLLAKFMGIEDEAQSLMEQVSTEQGAAMSN